MRLGEGEGVGLLGARMAALSGVGRSRLLLLGLAGTRRITRTEGSICIARVVGDGGEARAVEGAVDGAGEGVMLDSRGRRSITISPNFLLLSRLLRRRRRTRDNRRRQSPFQRLLELKSKPPLHRPSRKLHRHRWICLRWVEPRAGPTWSSLPPDGHDAALLS